MKILIACEESQRVCIAMRTLGHEAYSCDLQSCSGGHPEWHIRADAREIAKLKWDMVIAHPPCTYLAASGAVRLMDKDGNIKDVERYIKGYEASRLFQFFLDLDCEKVAVENPVMLKLYGIRKYDQIIEPYMFGEPWRKKTCLWLKGLPKLEPTKIVEPRGLYVESTSARYDKTRTSKYELRGTKNQKLRSMTFDGIAKAMAEQWAGRYIKDGGLDAGRRTGEEGHDAAGGMPAVRDGL